MVRCIKGTANSSIFWSYILQLHIFANLTSDSACSPCSLALNLANFRLIAKWFTNDQRQKNLIIHNWTSTYYLSYLYGCMNKRLVLLLENKIACLIGKLHSLQRENTSSSLRNQNAHCVCLRANIPNYTNPIKTISHNLQCKLCSWKRQNGNRNKG